MPINYEPDYVPQGLPNKINPWEEKQKHSRIAKQDRSRDFFYTSPLTNVSLPAIAPPLTSGEYKVGTLYTASGAGATDPGGGSVGIVQGFVINKAPVGTPPTYTPVDGDYGNSMEAYATFTITGGTNDGHTETRYSEQGTVTDVAPIAALGLDDQNFIISTGVQTYDTSVDFTGLGISFSLTTAPSGVTINASTGVVSHPTNSGAYSGSVVVRATNLDGLDESGYTVNVSTVSATNYSREYTDGTGDEVIDLSTIGPAELGTTSYVLQGSPTGVSVLAKDLTIDTNTALSGVVTVRRNDDNGDRDLVLTLTMTDATVDIVSGAGEIEWGADTRPNAEIYVSFTGGIYAPQSFTTSPAEIDAIVSGQGLQKLAPVISLSTDTGAANELDPDDVATVDVIGLWIYKSGNTAPTITSTGWHDQAGLLQAGSGDYTGDNPATETTSIFFRESDGTNNGDSGTINVAPGTPFNSTDLFTASDGVLIEMANSAAWTDTVGGTAAGINDDVLWWSDISGGANHADTNYITNPPKLLDEQGVKYTNLSNIEDESIDRNGLTGLVSNGPRTHLALLKREPTTGDTFYLSEGVSGVEGTIIYFRADDDGALVWAPDDVTSRQTFAGSVTGLDVKVGPRIIGYRTKSGVATIDNTDDFQIYADGTWIDLAAQAVTFNIPDFDYRCGRVRGTNSVNTDVAAWLIIDRHLTDAEVVSLSNFWKGLV